MRPATAAAFHGAAGPPDWVGRLHIEPRSAERLDGATLRELDVAVLDADSTDALTLARRIRALEPMLHLIIAAPPQRRPELERALLFTPGLGEVWIVDADAVEADTLRSAADITRTRRGYEVSRAQLAASLSGFPERRRRSAPYISDAYLAALLQVLPDPILSIDDEGCVLSSSPAARRTLLLDEGDAGGRGLADLVRPADPAAFARLLELGCDDTATDEIQWLRADGAARTAEVTVTPLRLADQRVRALVMRDTTEARATQRMLEEQAAELEAQTLELAAQTEQLTAHRDELERLAAERKKVLDELRSVVASRSRFYAGMSHEIRTPINAILGYNDLLLAGVYGDLAPEQAEGLQRAQAAARHLRELVNDVLDLSKIESGKIGLSMEPVVLHAIVDEVVATIEPLSRDHDAPIRCELDESITIVTDPRRVRQILLNLLSNAVKFGAGQAVHVCTGVLSPDSVYIEVRDRGPGIEPAQLERIFEEFVQLESVRQGGTGLGLSISKRLAAALGGSLAVASSPGAGSTFTLTLPRNG